VALRGHASIQGSTDIPTLYHSIHGYMSAPSALKSHASLGEWLAEETKPTGYWANTPKFMVSYLKSMYGAAATRDNDFGYDWHPKIIGDHSHMPMFVAMNEGRVKGMFCIGQNPATSLNAKLERSGLRKLDWLVVKDNWLHETAMFWKTRPRCVNGEVATADIKTEVFFFPSSQVAEYDGSFTNTQRLLQWHYKAADPPGDCRSDMYFTYNLGKRLKRCTPARRCRATRASRTWSGTTSPTTRRQPGEPDVREDPQGDQRLLQRRPGRHLAGPDDLPTTARPPAPRGSTAACSRRRTENRSANRRPTRPACRRAPGLGLAWPSNRRISTTARRPTRRAGRGASARSTSGGTRRSASGSAYDVPDFPLDQAAHAGPAGRDRHGRAFRHRRRSS
jgi:formate dehydrogenase major subunit